MLKKRNWAFILYPESAPENWRDVLKGSFVKCAVSPIHDKDLTDDGEIKKPHFHILLCYDGATTYNNVLTLTQSLNATIPQVVDSVDGYYNYLSHTGFDDKYQYNPDDVSTYNGFALKKRAPPNDPIRSIKVLFQIIFDNGICEYSDLISFLITNDLDDFLTLVWQKPQIFQYTLNSIRYKKSINNEN